MATTSTGPGVTVCASKNCSPIPGTAHGATVKTTLLLKPNINTYDNGFELCGAQYGDSNADEGSVYQCEIKAKHPNTTTPYDKNTTVFTAGQGISVFRHEFGKEYWLPIASATIAVGDKIITGALGVAIAQTAHTATSLPHHTWVCTLIATAKTYVRARYIGITPMFTAA